MWHHDDTFSTCSSPGYTMVNCFNTQFLLSHLRTSGLSQTHQSFGKGWLSPWQHKVLSGLWFPLTLHYKSPNIVYRANNILVEAQLRFTIFLSKDIRPARHLTFTSFAIRITSFWWQQIKDTCSTTTLLLIHSNSMMTIPACHQVKAATFVKWNINYGTRHRSSKGQCMSFTRWTMS
jgi:hypothetical protein